MANGYGLHYSGKIRIDEIMKELCDKIKWESVRKLNDGWISFSSFVDTVIKFEI